MRRPTLALALAIALVGVPVGAAAASPTLIPPGAFKIWNNAPADAQSVTFTFNAACTNAGVPVPGSPFTLAHTGTGYTGLATGLAGGTRCTVTPVPLAGFSASPASKVLIMVAGEVQIGTFTQTRTTGALKIWNNAPANAGSVTFRYAVACTLDGSAVPGSPFMLARAGTGYTQTISGLPTGTRCTVTPKHVNGFVDLAPKRSIITAGATQILTFTNTWASGVMWVWNEAPADAQDVRFTFDVVCDFDWPGGWPDLFAVTGSGYTDKTFRAPADTRCTVTPKHVAGFVDLPPKVSILTAGERQILTFVQHRS